MNDESVVDKREKQRWSP